MRERWVDVPCKKAQRTLLPVCIMIEDEERRVSVEIKGEDAKGRKGG